MTQDQVLGYLRSLCAMAASILGYSAAQADKLTAGIMGLAAFVFFVISVVSTWKANSAKSRLLSVANNPSVAQVQLAPDAAPALKAVAVDHAKISS